jgi:parallel beta-helix repeat protein
MVIPNQISTLYINPVTGNDANTGARLAPFKTITRALKGIESDIIIQLASGTYSAKSGEIFPLLIPSGVTVVGNEATKGQGILISGGGNFQSASFGVQNITILLLDETQLLGVSVTNSTPKATGVWIESTNPTLANNTFSNCGREGVFVSDSGKPAITDNLFVQNIAGGLVISRNSKGEILRNKFQQNAIGIAMSDFAAPLVVSNQFQDNRTAIAISRDTRPVFRNNLIANNPQGGLMANGNAIPDLGNAQDPGDNLFQNNGEFDIVNATSNKFVSAGNKLSPTRVKGSLDFISTTQDISTPVITNAPFPDLGGHWSVEFVAAMVNKGLMSGLPGGNFAPDAPMNRAAFAAVIAKAFQLPATNPIPNFTDIPGNFWAANAIKTAAAMGFISGFPDGSFRPGQNLTKIQAIVAIVNGLKLTGGNANVLSFYSDRSQIPSYATNSMAIATQKLLVVNYPQTEILEPLREITRAEVAAIIYQALVNSGNASAIFSPYIVKPILSIPSFTDLKGHWAESFIRALVSMDLTDGYSDGTYQPDKPITRAQYASLVVKAFNPIPKNPNIDFSDVKKDFWAYDAIQLAARTGFVGGYNDKTFRPQQNVQRLQIIVSLVNGLGLTAIAGDTLKRYVDHDSIPQFARIAVATATQQGIVVNYPDPKQIQPGREASRGEVSAMVYQALVAVKRASVINSTYIVSHLGNRQ